LADREERCCSARHTGQALLISALLEREVRTRMRAAALDNIALYPEFRDCKAPSTERILEIFSPVARHQLHRDGTLIQTFQPELTAQQLQVLELLGLFAQRLHAAGPVNEITRARRAERQMFGQ
jgi:hypothetical protein